MEKTFLGHFLAFLTVAIWGSTFVFTKMLLHEQITLWFLLGSLLIIVGMILSDKR